MLLPEFEAEIRNLPHLPSGMNPNGWFTEEQMVNFRVQIKAYILRQATAFYERQQALQDAPMQPQDAAGLYFFLVTDGLAYLRCIKIYQIIIVSFAVNIDHIVSLWCSFNMMFLLLVAIETSFFLLDQHGKSLLKPKRGTGKTLKQAEELEHAHKQKRERSDWEGEEEGEDEDEVDRNGNLHPEKGSNNEQWPTLGDPLTALLGQTQQPSWMASLTDVDAFDVFGDEEEEDEDSNYEEEEQQKEHKKRRVTIEEEGVEGSLAQNQGQGQGHGQDQSALGQFGGLISDFTEI